MQGKVMQEKKETRGSKEFKAKNRNWVQKSEEKKKAEDLEKLKNNHRIKGKEES